jgi:hypothetical protein
MPEEHFFNGARMAYRDCADMADNMASTSEVFVAIAIAGGFDDKMAQTIQLVAQQTLSTFADSIRSKIVQMDQMIAAAKAGVQ